MLKKDLLIMSVTLHRMAEAQEKPESAQTSKKDSKENHGEEKKPTCIIVLGMAGSGKTTFVTKIVSRLYDTGKPYVINLDPACNEVPYPANIGNIFSVR